MQRLFVLGVLGLSFLLLPMVAIADEAKSIFDGKTLEGWKVERCEAEVKDGAILIKAGNGVVYPNKRYADFVLDLEWKALKEDKWDSGIYFRCELPRGKRAWPTRWQANLLKGQEGNVGGLKGAKSTGLVKDREWNRFKLSVIGSKASLEINGKPAWKADGIVEKDGYICLQAEVPGGGQFLFRNIKITEITK
jgi:hypothetical protein